MGVRISALTAAVSANGAMEFPVNDAGTTKKATLTQVENMLASDWLPLIDINGRKLIYSDASTAYDWENGYIQKIGAGFPSIDLGNDLLIDSTGDNSINWDNRELHESSVSSFATINWDTGRMRDDGNVLSIDWYVRQMNNGSSTVVIDWELNQLTDSAAVVAFDWELRTMTDTGGNLSANFDLHQLYDINEILAIDYDLHILYDAAGAQIFDFSLAKTGWGTPTGTLSRTTFDESTVTLPQLAQKVAALITDLKGYHLLQA